MFFTWWRKLRRRKILNKPFPPAWLAILEEHVPHYRVLSPEEQALLRDRLRTFIAEKDWQACDGLRMTDDMRVTIAAQACLLTLGLNDSLFDHVQEVLVFPREFPAEEHLHLAGDVSLVREGANLGEAYYRGPVRLSWEEIQADNQAAGSGRNLVFHEFAHQLDMLDGAIDGTPPLENREQARRWQQVMTAEFQRLIQASKRGRATLLDHYGASDEAEFFAVATECFFDQPVQMAQRHAELYALLRDYYRQDPAARLGVQS